VEDIDRMLCACQQRGIVVDVVGNKERKDMAIKRSFTNFLTRAFPHMEIL
jgi:hypothetical protein